MLGKSLRSVVDAMVPAIILMALGWADSPAASFSEETQNLSRVIWVLVGVALVVALIAIFNENLLTRILGRLGRSSTEERGPNPGEGAVIHHSSGEADFDGAPEALPPPKKEWPRSTIPVEKGR
jgi:hypothetical protein